MSQKTEGASPQDALAVARAVAAEVQVPEVTPEAVEQMAAESAAWREAARANGKKLAQVLLGIKTIESNRGARSNPIAQKLLDEYHAAAKRLTQSDNEHFLARVQVATLYELIRTVPRDWNYFAFVVEKIQQYGRAVIKDKEPGQKNYPSGAVVTAGHVICHVEGGEKSKTNHGLFKELRGFRDEILEREKQADAEKAVALLNDEEVSDDLGELTNHNPGKYRLYFADPKDAKTGRYFREGVGIVELAHDKSNGRLELFPIDGAGSLARFLELGEERLSVPVATMDFGKLPHWFPEEKVTDALWFVDRVRAAIRMHRKSGETIDQVDTQEANG